MPISKENEKLYPGGSIRSPEWLAIRERIRDRAGDKCENCGVENGAIGFRLPSGTFIPASALEIDYPNIVLGLHVTFPTFLTGETPEFAECKSKILMIVCTVAHKDQQLTDHSDGNLAFWCQRCHNRHDAPSRRANAKKTRAAKSAQAELL